MASLDFPSNPTNGQTYALNGVTYYYNSTMGAWLTQLTSMNLSTSSNTQVLFNDAGIANGSSGLVFDKIANTATVNALNTVGSLGVGTTSPSGYGLLAALGNANNTTTSRIHVGNASAGSGAIAMFTLGNDYVAGAGVAGLKIKSGAFTGAANEYEVFNNIGPVNFTSGGTTAIYIPTNGASVGIGTTSPLSRLHVANEIRVGRTDASAEGGEIKFCRSSDDAAAYSIDVYGSGSSPEFRFFNSIGGTVLQSASPAGVNYIKFNPTQNADGDANALDDYEEGTWTPTLVAATGTITSQSTIGRYVKIGRLVVVNFQAQITGGTVSVISRIEGLPFTVRDVQYVTGAAREWYATGLMWETIAQQDAAYLNLIRYDNSSSAGVNFGWSGTHSYFTST